VGSVVMSGVLMIRVGVNMGRLVLIPRCRSYRFIYT
jgi:hypothetical protein